MSYSRRRTASEKAASITVAEYLAGEELAEVMHEYAGGEAHAMAGATDRHNDASTNPDGDHFQGQPVVVVEVLGEFTRRVDLGEKRAASLAVPTLKVPLVVDSDEPRVTLQRRQPEG